MEQKNRRNGYDIALVQRLLQHSSSATTQRYIGIEPQRIEKAIEAFQVIHNKIKPDYAFP
jgi:site-specific recombinase XerD